MFYLPKNIAIFALSLLIITMAANAYGTGNSPAPKHSDISHQDDRCIISQPDFYLALSGTEQLRNVKVQHESSRPLNLNFLFKIAYSQQIVSLRFLTSAIFHHFHLACKQINGFYLFYLCKLLI